MPTGTAMMVQGVAAMRGGVALAASSEPSCCCSIPPPTNCEPPPSQNCPCSTAPGCGAIQRFRIHQIIRSTGVTTTSVPVTCCCGGSQRFALYRVYEYYGPRVGGGVCLQRRVTQQAQGTNSVAGFNTVQTFSSVDCQPLGPVQTIPNFATPAPCNPGATHSVPREPDVILGGPGVINEGYIRVDCSSFELFDYRSNGFSYSIRRESAFVDSFQCHAPGIQCGACCCNGQCYGDTNEAACAQMGGTYKGHGSTCWPPQLCNEGARPKGACCKPDGTCSQTTLAECQRVFGTWLGEGINCATQLCPQPPQGACCLPGGTCTETTLAACQNAGGTYQGNNVPCVNVNCNPVSGACCYPTGGCIIEPGRTPCEQAGGTYLGDGTDCTGNPCGVGGCCLPNGNCLEMTSLGCSQNSGTFLGPGVPCGTISCLGCCCLDPVANSQTTSPLACFQLGGTFYGINTTCTIITEPRGVGDTTGVINCANPPPQPRQARVPVLSGSEAFL